VVPLPAIAVAEKSGIVLATPLRPSCATSFPKTDCKASNRKSLPASVRSASAVFMNTAR